MTDQQRQWLIILLNSISIIILLAIVNDMKSENENRICLEASI